MKIIKSAFPGTCNKCKQPFPAGTEILWERGNGACHVAVCPPAPAPVPVQVKLPIIVKPTIDQTGIVTFLQNAAAKIKFPKARFLAPDGRSELRLSLAGSTSKYKGAIQIKVNQEWIGRIGTDGTVAGNISPNIIETLAKIAADPAKAAKEYGALTCRCSFCNLPLTDEGSVEVGYGKVCASHWGLPHKQKGTKILTEVK